MTWGERADARTWCAATIVAGVAFLLLIACLAGVRHTVWSEARVVSVYAPTGKAQFGGMVTTAQGSLLPSVGTSIRVRLANGCLARGVWRPGADSAGSRTPPPEQWVEIRLDSDAHANQHCASSLRPGDVVHLEVGREAFLSTVINAFLRR